MWRRSLSFLSHRSFSSSSIETPPSLYSFLQPSLFSLTNSSPPPPPPPTNPSPNPLSPDAKTSLEASIHRSLSAHDTDEAWKSFKSLTGASSFPSKSISNSLITHLSSLGDVLNLKRAFVSVVFLIEKNPNSLQFDTLTSVLRAMCAANTPAPAFALVKCMFKNRFFVPFDVWGPVLVEIGRKNGSSVGFFRVFGESCRVALDEKLDFMKPDLIACNAALEGCCYELESVGDAERVVELMWQLGVKPDESSFGYLAYLYALKGLKEKISELNGLMGGFGFTDMVVFLSNLTRGYVKSGDLEAVSETLLQALRDGGGQGLELGEELYAQVVQGFIKSGSVKDLAGFVIQSQMIEDGSIMAERSVGFGILNACVNLQMLDKAHGILDEMNARGTNVGLGVYLPILRAYCNEQRTAEAAEMVAEINRSELRLDASCYDALIEASMSNQDFQSAFSLFRELRDTNTSDLKGSYLTIMTGLTENNRPELMAAFLDEVVGDPRIEVGTHDWNSTIHSFCKGGRLEDARRTFRRMIFLQFEPNAQTYLSLINGFVSAGKYFSVLLLWNEVRKQASTDGGERLVINQSMIDAFLYALVKGGFFDAVMQVVEKSQELKIFVDKWRYKQAFMEHHKKLKVSKMRRRNYRKMEALIAFKNWAGLNA